MFISWIVKVLPCYQQIKELQQILAFNLISSLDSLKENSFFSSGLSLLVSVRMGINSYRNQKLTICLNLFLKHIDQLYLLFTFRFWHSQATDEEEELPFFTFFLFLSFGSSRAYGVRLNKLCNQLWVNNMIRSTVGLSVFSFLEGIINGSIDVITFLISSHHTDAVYWYEKWMGKEILDILCAPKNGKTFNNSFICIR